MFRNSITFSKISSLGTLDILGTLPTSPRSRMPTMFMIIMLLMSNCLISDISPTFSPSFLLNA